MQTRTHWTATGPIAYCGQAALQLEVDTIKAFAGAEDTFLTTTAPASLEAYRRNEFYATQDEFVFALAEALRTEYEMVAAAGLLVQVDDAWLTAMWDRTGIAIGLDAFRAWCMVRAGAYLFEAANARHEHEYEIWESVKLPAGKIIVPGVVTHSTDIVEHPALVAQRKLASNALGI